MIRDENHRTAGSGAGIEIVRMPVELRLPIVEAVISCQDYRRD